MGSEQSSFRPWKATFALPTWSTWKSSPLSPGCGNEVDDDDYGNDFDDDSAARWDMTITIISTMAINNYHNGKKKNDYHDNNKRDGDTNNGDDSDYDDDDEWWWW